MHHKVSIARISSKISSLIRHWRNTFCKSDQSGDNRQHYGDAIVNYGQRMVTLYRKYMQGPVLSIRALLEREREHWQAYWRMRRRVCREPISIIFKTRQSRLPLICSWSVICKLALRRDLWCPYREICLNKSQCSYSILSMILCDWRCLRGMIELDLNEVSWMMDAQIIGVFDHQAYFHLRGYMESKRPCRSRWSPINRVFIFHKRSHLLSRYCLGCSPSLHSTSEFHLMLRTTTTDTYRPDLFVIGFQEIVPLTAQQILQTDPEQKQVLSLLLRTEFW